MMERRSLPMLNHVLQHTLRSLCCDKQWVYAVFWRILPRNYPPPKWENEGVMDRSKGNKRNWILVWEDGFCDFPACSSGREALKLGARFGNHAFNHADESAETVMHPELFFKMSHEVYNYGEGLMGKVAADNSHKWVYKEPMEHEISFLSPWHGSLDPHPRTWESQFKAGIETIAVIAVHEGLVQLGSTKKVVEDLNAVILMQRKFNYLLNIPGVFVPHPSSPIPGFKRRDGTLDDSPPTDGACWPGNRDPTLINGLLARSNSEPYRMALHGRTFSNGVLGMKRPPENEILQSFTGGRDLNRFLPSGMEFNGSPRFDYNRQLLNGNRQPECPSPPKAPNTGSPNSISLLQGSMSSLHNLLSKLPSVTTPESSASLASSPSGLSLPTPLQNQQHPLPRQPRSPSSSMDSPNGIGVSREEQNPSDRSVSSDPSRLTTHPCGNGVADNSPESLTSNSPRGDHDSSDVLGETCMGPSGSQMQNLQQNSWQSTNSSEFTDNVRGSRNHHHQQRPEHANKNMGPASKEKLTSFLDSFENDTLTDQLGFNEDLLENSEAYNSFLSEII